MPEGWPPTYEDRLAALEEQVATIALGLAVVMENVEVVATLLADGVWQRQYGQYEQALERARARRQG
jgi:hypothetical protein